MFKLFIAYKCGLVAPTNHRHTLYSIKIKGIVEYFNNEYKIENLQLSQICH